MPARPIQISIDSDLLERIDRDPEAREKGRSAFLRAAAELYLADKRRRDLERRLAEAYEGQAEAMADEVAELLDRQSWPTE